MTETPDSTEGYVKPFGEAEAPLSHPDLFSTVAEGGEVQSIASGWRLAVREFADNKVAVVGVGILVFFVLFCFIGPLFYHTNQIAHPAAERQSVTRAGQPPERPRSSGPTNTDSTSWVGSWLGGQTALEIGFFAAFISIVIGTLYGSVSGLWAG